MLDISCMEVNVQEHKYACCESLSWFPNSSQCFPLLFAEWPEFCISVLPYYLEHQFQLNHFPYKQGITIEILKCHSVSDHSSKLRMKCLADNDPEWSKPFSSFPKQLPVDLVSSFMWYVFDVEKETGPP